MIADLWQDLRYGARMLMKRFGLLVVSLALCAGFALARTQGAALKPGDVAPEIKLGKLLQSPPGTVTDWKSLKGKTVVVEFWATWCSPCMPALAHLNELADKFKDQPIQFIAITDEDDEAMLAQFLKQRPIRGWVGCSQPRCASNSVLK